MEGHGEEAAVHGVGAVAGDVEAAGVGLLEVVPRVRLVQCQRQHGEGRPAHDTGRSPAGRQPVASQSSASSGQRQIGVEVDMKRRQEEQVRTPTGYAEGKKGQRTEE